MDTLIEKVRRVLGPLWDKSPLRGRCYGPKGIGSSFHGATIVLADERELVTVSQGESGRLEIREFCARQASGSLPSTSLGDEARKLLQQAGFSLEE